MQITAVAAQRHAVMRGSEEERQLLFGFVVDEFGVGLTRTRSDTQTCR